MRFLDHRIELFINPRPYDRTPLFGQPRYSLAPTAYFLWGYDMLLDANVLAFRAFPRTSAVIGIVGWGIDWTIERPIWRRRRVRFDWNARAKSEARYFRFLRQVQREKRRDAA